MTTQNLARPRRYRPPAQLGGRTPLNGTFKRRATIVGFLAPALIILGAFVAWPMISALQLSFTDASGFGTPEFVGLDNYVRVFTDSEILQSMGNTALYAVLFTPTAIVVALVLALVINSPRLPFRGFFRSTLFLPFIVSLAVAAFAWSYLLDPQIGLLNYWLQAVGIRIGNVLQDPALAMPTVVAVAVWKSFGFYMVIFLAGLQEIPTSLYEAAQLDGANGWKRFTNVTFPMLSNTMAFVVIVALIAALQAFDQIYVLTGGGPYRSTETIVMQIYQSGFKDLDLGFASALSYVLLIVTLLLSLVQFLFFGRRSKDINS
ncbi:carbohydrate ABC transporter membrane protein 1, CUT1 family [Agreia bicolorata]|uniref:Carbohydrate ABC transporter membrane protein 1, CUT1 family n=1 Tax=Agreia bicolorata TaxID=110935 RepID=A0A1T4Y2Z9_9MICO|nr:sugar ABC transporter permease [Agreia bicolorata]KJC64604.1 sugar ABC transporter permease [Agreia bicolorata]SKA96172.1 carbohydrate ABC transporter membrane protein 1, CUT1 family [Agreia bicolorata]